jgi:hypothetical protein
MKKIRLLLQANKQMQDVFSNIFPLRIRQKLRKKTNNPNIKIFKLFEFIIGKRVDAMFTKTDFIFNGKKQSKITFTESTNTFLNKNNKALTNPKKHFTQEYYQLKTRDLKTAKLVNSNVKDSSQKLGPNDLKYISSDSIDKEIDTIVEKLIEYQTNAD